MARKKKTSAPIPDPATPAAEFAAMKMAVAAGYEAFAAASAVGWAEALRPHRDRLMAAVAAYREADLATFDDEAAELIIDGYCRDDEADPAAYFEREFGPPEPFAGAEAAEGGPESAKPPEGGEAGPPAVARPGRPDPRSRGPAGEGGDFDLALAGGDTGYPRGLEDAIGTPLARGPGAIPADVTIAIPAAELEAIERLLADRVEVVAGIEEAADLHLYLAPLGDVDLVVAVTNGTAGAAPVEVRAWVIGPGDEILDERPLVPPLAARHAIRVGGERRVLEIVAY